MLFIVLHANLGREKSCSMFHSFDHINDDVVWHAIIDTIQKRFHWKSLKRIYLVIAKNRRKWRIDLQIYAMSFYPLNIIVPVHWILNSYIKSTQILKYAKYIYIYIYIWISIHHAQPKLGLKKNLKLMLHLRKLTISANINRCI